jgi:2-keto-4-pentenoate hydratase/2-oxohepta-3-ene-1,7-dioic acid hydratase in catechol pathway
MRRVRFEDPAGAVRTGEWTDRGIEFGGETYDRSAVRLLPPCEPTKFVCVGWNYADHAAEKDIEVPDRPTLFFKPPSAVVRPGGTVSLPRGKETVEFEGELAVVVSEQARNVDAADAWDVIEGFTVVDDVSNRDDQNVEQSWVRGKGFDNSAPLGPVVASPDEVPDDAYVRTYLNGELCQDGDRTMFIFTVPEIIEEVTRYVTLEPGDVVTTGTPEGVRPLSDGDHVAVEVEGVGTLEHTVEGP